ncbi:hypothetical protein OH773_11415 [Buttiauxella sp. WJP83]|nr:hypothetical protein [Buttiauxella sp. WJP83]WBM72927.1 hypothetical protein OH773_11415 [Buttiauxella sp. WJP83]
MRSILVEGMGTNPYQCILCGDRLRIAGAQAGQHATEMLSERLGGIAKKRWRQVGSSG